MTKSFRSFLAGALLVTAATTATAQTYSVEGASPASLTGIVAQTLAQHASTVDVDLQAVLGQTLTKSALKLGAGQIDLAVVPPLAFKAMQRGGGPYKDMAEQAQNLSQNVRFLFSFPGGTFHTIVWADSDIDSWDDLEGKRVYIGPPAGAANAMIRGMIELATGGLKDGDNYEGIRAPWNSGQQAFQDGQFDVFVTSTAVGQQSINELGLQREIRILGIPDDVTRSDAWAEHNANMGLDTATIPAETYSGQANSDQDLLTNVTVMMMAANKDLPDDVAYKLTKVYWENLPEMKKQNALMRSIDESKPFEGAAVPLHSGALRYYEEQGIEVPENLVGG